MNLKTYAVSEVKHLKIWGRTRKELTKAIPLFWTGSGIECRIRGGELWIEVEVDFEVYEPWIGIVINDVYVGRQMLPKGRRWICIFRGMNSQVIKKVKVIKEVQAMSEDEKHSLQIKGFKTDGIFEAVPEYPFRLEFIGDSITSGEGSIGAKEEEDWISMWFSTENNYARMTADALNAEYHILSQSGWGVYCGWDNNRTHQLPTYYKQVCGVAKGIENQVLGAQETYDFTTWQPDIVVINLGTNDEGAFHNAPWQDEVTGMWHQQKMELDGTYCIEDMENVKRAIYSFLVTLRQCHPEARLVWCYGMLGHELLPYITEATEQYKAVEKDQKVSVLVLPDTTTKTIGARMHPGKRAHEQAAQTLVDYLRPMLPIK